MAGNWLFVGNTPSPEPEENLEQEQVTHEAQDDTLEKTQKQQMDEEMMDPNSLQPPPPLPSTRQPVSFDELHIPRVYAPERPRDGRGHRMGTIRMTDWAERDRRLFEHGGFLEQHRKATAENRKHAKYYRQQIDGSAARRDKAREDLANLENEKIRLRNLVEKEDNAHKTAKEMFGDLVAEADEAERTIDAYEAYINGDTDELHVD